MPAVGRTTPDEALAAVGGSAIRVDYAGGRAYVAAWNDAQVFDVSTPSAPRFIGAARMKRAFPSSF